MSMYRVLCVNSLWCSQNMCDLAWLVSLNKTLLLNRMWGYIMGGLGSLAINFITPYRIIPVRCQPFWKHVFSTSQAVAMILLEQSWFAIVPRCPAWVGTRAGFTYENSGGGLNVAKRITIPQLPQLPSWITCCMIGIPIQNDKKLSQPQNIPKCRFVLYRSYVQKKAKNTMELHHLFLVP